MPDEGNSTYDVFLSHNSADKPLVERLATRLQDEGGMSPFLDKWHLVPGEPWQEALEKALDGSATCAVFLGPSGLGTWENEEMRAALEERVRNQHFRVIPVLLPGAYPKDPDTLPRFLRRLTWVDFSSGIDDTEAFHRLVAGIRGQAPGRDVSGPIVGRAAEAGFLRRLAEVFRQPIVLLILPTAFVAGVTLMLQHWRLPTRVGVKATVNRADFRVGGADWVPILNTVSFQSLTVERFQRISFGPAKLEEADPASYLLLEDRFPESAWKSVLAPSPCVITPGNEMLMPAVTLESTAPDTNRGTLDRLQAAAGSGVTLEVSGTGRGLTVKLQGKESSAAVLFASSYKLTATHAGISGIDSPMPQADSVTYRATPSEDRPEIEVAGQPSALAFILTVPKEKATSLFSRGSIPVTTLDFTRQEENGSRVSALVGAGEISYPDFPGIQNVMVEPPAVIGLDQLKRFSIEEIALDPANHGMRFRLDGVAGDIRTGSATFREDRRLTALTMLWQKPSWLFFLAIVVWIIPTIVAAYRLYRDLRARRT
jgi:hypothetical protein